jgi:hypothetical protein
MLKREQFLDPDSRGAHQLADRVWCLLVPGQGREFKRWLSERLERTLLGAFVPIIVHAGKLEALDRTAR